MQRLEGVTGKKWAPEAIQWGLLLLVLAGSIWAVTQQREAPQLILLFLLYVIAVNFTLPLPQGLIGLAPVVSVSSLLVVRPETAVLLAGVGLLAAELVRPLWRPIWETLNLPPRSRLDRFGPDVIYLVALITAGLAYRQSGGQSPLPPDSSGAFWPYVWLVTVYGAVYFLLVLLLWRLTQRPLRSFLLDHSLTILATGALAQPFAIFGGVTFTQSGLAGFVIFCIGVMAVAIFIWLSWRHRYILEQQLVQLARLNEVGQSLRETLELPAVLERTQAQLMTLIPADRYTIFLAADGDRLTLAAINDNRIRPEAAFVLSIDDFTRWVAKNRTLLDLDGRNMHFAAHHNLTPPQPKPVAWIGVPLLTGDELLGVIALQRYEENGRPFTHWSRQVLLAVAGQASAAIQNARLYSETVRLYNRTDEALAQRVEQLQALLNTVREGVLMLDTNGRVVLINHRAATLLRQSPADLRRQKLDPAQAAAHLDYGEADWGDLLTLLQRGDVPDGRYHTFQTMLPLGEKQVRRVIEREESPVRFQEGKVMGWLLILRDITEEQELAERRSDLTRMIVHDLRNPLTTLISTINLLSEHVALDDDAEAERLLVQARHGCFDMLDMVDSLMDINRMEAGQAVVDADAMRLPPVVDEVLRRLRPLARQKQITLTSDHSLDLPAVWADGDMVRRVLINLLDNALKFTPANGRIHIQMQPEPPDDNADAGVRCTVSDTGPGIPPESRELVFDRFMRTNRGGAQVRGTGLGLTFCKLTVEAHNGRIWAEDGPDGGSCFIFTLPGIPHFW